MELILLIILPLVYWCVDEKKCLHLGIMTLISMWVNLLLRFMLDQSRPFFEGHDPSAGGFPAEYAQNTLVMLTIISSWLTKKWVYALAAGVCLLVGFACVYFSINAPIDILGAWLVGAILLVIYFFVNKHIEKLLAAHSPRLGLVACAVLAFVMILYRPSEEFLLPGGTLLGLGTGYFLCRRYTGFNAANFLGRSGGAKYLTLAGRFAAGIAGFFLLYIVTEKVVNIFVASENFHLIIFMRFAALAIWVSAGAPWLFRFLRLAAEPAQ